MSGRRNEITLEFEDGSTESVHLKVRHLIEAEDKFGRGPNGTPPLRGTIYAAWLALDKPRNGFQSFLKTIDSVVLPDDGALDDEDEDNETTPTQAARSEES